VHAIDREGEPLEPAATGGMGQSHGTEP
jgi:hypothetical protein